MLKKEVPQKICIMLQVSNRCDQPKNFQFFFFKILGIRQKFSIRKMTCIEMSTNGKWQTHLFLMSSSVFWYDSMNWNHFKVFCTYVIEFRLKLYLKQYRKSLCIFENLNSLKLKFFPFWKWLFDNHHLHPIQ